MIENPMVTGAGFPSDNVFREAEYCPACGELIEDDNKAVNCEICGEDGCERCLSWDTENVVYMCGQCAEDRECAEEEE